MHWDAATFNAWSVGLGIGGIILFKIYVIWRLTREARGGNFGALVIAGALGLGLLSVIVGAAVWLVLTLRQP